MGRLADAAGFQIMFLVVALLPLLGLGALRWLGTGKRLYLEANR
jgi:hypothetical protein